MDGGFHGRLLHRRGQDRARAFMRGEVDVLLGSAAIGTGVDGLQAVCDAA